MTTWDVVASVLIVLLSLVAQWRWIRVAQREHYQPGRVLAIAGLWMRAVPTNLLLLVVLVTLGVLGAIRLPLLGVAAALVALCWPAGLALVHRTSPLKVTDRVKRLLAITVLLQLVVAIPLVLLGVVALVPLLTPLIAESALVVARPIERALGRKYQVSAAAKIKRLAPRVVAITGSYGKTSTKNYAAHLMAGRYAVMASPASFNNVMGLSTAVNTRLEGGTDIFVAEMGTYGPGEIAALCEMFRPEVSAITTIGEAHLERMKSRETIVRAKAEILPPAGTVVLNVEVPELATYAAELAATKRVIRCATTDEVEADVVVRRTEAGWVLRLAGADHAVDLPAETGHPINVAIAVGLALAVEVPERTVLDRLAGLPATPHRAETTRTESGLTVIDDTYNSNPDGAAQALARARAIAGDEGCVFTITPGMVELGCNQAARNADFARAATAEERMELCIVGRTNLAALSSGRAERTRRFPSRVAAVADVMARAGARDVVLYENDLPDHYP